jgi:putative ABC transport system substrate-binding protein
MQFDQFGRREFIAFVGGAAAAWPLAARAQKADRTRIVGVLMNVAEADTEGQTRVAAFREGLNKLGWIEGRNIQMEYRWGAGDLKRLSSYAADLVALKPDVIFAGTSACAVALQRETRAIPIIFAQAFDPVGLGLVTSVLRPGGNITGFALYEFAIAGKWIELLKLISPNVTRLAVIREPDDPSASGFMPIIEQSARTNGAEVTTYIVRDDTEITQAIDMFAREPNGGLIPLPSPLMVSHRDLIISLAVRHQLPNIYAYRYYPASGGLASYGVDNIITYGQAAGYIDRILKGEKPSELPFQFPTRYQLVINLKTAKALGLTIPQDVLSIADEIIESPRTARQPPRRRQAPVIGFLRPTSAEESTKLLGAFRSGLAEAESKVRT